jgi:hypothetical protein
VKMVEFNRRWAALLPFTDMKVFLSGVSHLTQMNAFEYRDMMKCVLVITRGPSFTYVYNRIFPCINVYNLVHTQAHTPHTRHAHPTPRQPHGVKTQRG